MAAPKSIATPLAELAHQLIKDAVDADPETRLEIFKVLTQYHVGTSRVTKKDKEPSSHDNFAGFKNEIASTGE